MVEEITSSERYYINQRIDLLNSDLKGDIANLKDEVVELKQLVGKHLDTCEIKMCKLEEKYDKRFEPLESFRTKLVAVGTLILAVLGLAKFG